MTFKRVVNRNGLADGDYMRVPERHRKRVVSNATEGTSLSPKETKLLRFDDLAKRVQEYEDAFRMLAGDLRRLEKDAVDENAICIHVASRIGLDVGTVAVVLKEFIEW